MARYKSSRGYAVYTDMETSYGGKTSLAARKGIRPDSWSIANMSQSWREEPERVTLQFQYLDGPFGPVSLLETSRRSRRPNYSRHSIVFGAFVSRDRIMEQVFKAGLRGFHAIPMDAYSIEWSMAENRRRHSEPVQSQ